MPLPNAQYWSDEFSNREFIPERRHRDKEAWNAKAAEFAHKPKRSGYLLTLLDMLAPEPGTSVFDMGCGPGMLAIPLAQAGCTVYAVDFSEAMLTELDAQVKAEGLEEKVRSYQRAWAEDWSDLPVADVAISSRSLITDDLAGALTKLESKATREAILTIAAGSTPWRDAELLAALGVEVGSPEDHRELVCVTNWLIASGRLPRLDYIRVPTSTHSHSLEELAEHVRNIAARFKQVGDEELERFMSAHALFDETAQSWALDFRRLDSWAVIRWKPGRA